MLNAHPGIGVPYESHFYNVFWPLLKHYEPLDTPSRQKRLVADVLSMAVFRDWGDPPGVDAVVARIERGDFHGVVEAVLREWADGRGKRRWGEKTPQHGSFWRQILEGFPRAQFVHVVRDGRDCALSWIASRFGPKDAYHVARRWAQYIDLMGQLKQSLGSDQFYEISYEDLVADPEAALKSLCGFLGEPFDPAMLEFHSSGDNYMTDARNQQNLQQPVMKQNTAKWRKQMSPRDQRLFEAVAGEQLKRYGYAALYPDAAVGTWEHVCSSYLTHPSRKALAMLHNTKGWGDGLLRLRIRARLHLSPPK